MKVGGASLEGYPRFDPYNMFVGIIPYMVEQARGMADSDAYSYRNFVVGGAIYGVNESLQETTINAAGNTKREPRTKVCAERKILGQARKAGATKAIGLVVAATTDIEKIAGVMHAEAPTLHPCDDCRAFFDEHPLIQPDTIIVTTGLDKDIYQVQTAEELRAMYANPTNEALGRLPTFYGFNNWSTKHQALYGALKGTERFLPPEEQRSPALLAKMAIMGTF